VIGGGQEASLREHVGMRNRCLDVVAHEPLVEEMVLAGGVREHALIERRSLVPQAAHAEVELCCSAGLRAVKSGTTRVPVPSLVKISASKLSGDL
jgi:hypothetical protein